MLSNHFAKVPVVDGVVALELVNGRCGGTSSINIVGGPMQQPVALLKFVLLSKENDVFVVWGGAEENIALIGLQMINWFEKLSRVWERQIPVYMDLNRLY
ncbi:unnamed protein product [Onchocerca flexuosa]|uniref:Penicillin-binding protein 2 n=1 Tax=Onchocerca flexuosa TaxID=387005 RepID=A0A183GXY0_9BILA|nr:unnamed protein product [Onchocerca flexuosa]